jgi:hypothetical protein
VSAFQPSEPGGISSHQDRRKGVVLGEGLGTFTGEGYEDMSVTNVSYNFFDKDGNLFSKEARIGRSDQCNLVGGTLKQLKAGDADGNASVTASLKSQIDRYQGQVIIKHMKLMNELVIYL